MLRPVLACLIPAVALLISCTGCASKERQELADDTARFNAKTQVELEQLKVDIDRYARSNALIGENIPLDAQRFLEWRRREWWRLRDEFAHLTVHEWRQVEKLTCDVGRYYGYNVRNFPRLNADVLRFFHRADAEWRNLVMDVAIFIEFKHREQTPLRADLKAFYDRVGWEIANLQIDVLQFTEWREREYKKLVKNGREWFRANLDDADKLADEVERFRVHVRSQGALLEADFARFGRYEDSMVPRLVDDVYRYTEWREREFERLATDFNRFAVEHTRWQSERLEEDIWRYRRAQADLWPKLMLDVDRFFVIYEREVRPLQAEVKRWWRTNIASGQLLMDDLRAFYRHADQEVAELEADVRRFIDYGSQEWKNLVRQVKRFATDAHDPAFGDATAPSQGSHDVKVFDDHMPPRTHESTR